VRRFTLTASPDALTGFFGLADVPPLEPRYNIAPTQQVFAVRANAAGTAGKPPIGRRCHGALSFNAVSSSRRNWSISMRCTRG
jgi:putative SOS response-associated peptidase YedK